MQKVAIGVFAVLILVAAIGCGGPTPCVRGFDDWMNEKYTGSPWLFGNIVATSLAGVVYGVTFMVDALFVNAYYFWVKDAQPFGSGTGTKFDHKPVTPK